MKGKDVTALTYTLVIGMAAILFFCGILIGNLLAQHKIGDVTNIEEELRTQTIGAEIQYQLLLQETCNYLNADSLSKELVDVGSQLDTLEQRRGSEDTEVLQLKNRYAILEIQHWLFTERAKQQCNTTDIPVLYFYDTKCASCKQQGEILTTVRASHPYLRVYSFDVNLSNPALDLLKQKFNIKSTPTLVILNQSRGFTTQKELTSLVNLQ
jgi:hypothetical protein